MKKITALISALLVCLFLTSCGGDFKLDYSVFDVTYKEKHGEVFYNDSCEHIILCLYNDGISDGYSPEEYHYKYCKRGNCSYEPRFEKHNDELIIVSIAPAYFISNGWYYHKIELKCAECNSVVKSIYILCQTQTEGCDGSCFEYKVGGVYK